MTKPPSERHRLFAKLYWLQRIWEPLGMWHHRRAVCGGATGTTLEIGVGTGFSFPYYRIERLVACDPNVHMLHAARARAASSDILVSFVAARAEALPFRDCSFETIVSCLTFCTITDPHATASEIERVLAPEGQFRFVEHGRSTRPVFAAFQRFVTPAWKRLFGGCRLNRNPSPPIGSLHLQKIRRCSAGTVARGTATRILATEEPALTEAETA